MKEQPEAFYLSIPPLREYINRIGAEENNFRRFMVKVYKGPYYVEKSIVRLAEDGTISADNPEFDPTKIEAEAIREAMKGISFPKSIKADDIRALRKKLGAKAVLYEFYDRRDGGKIIMAQQRIIRTDTGLKDYIPWCLFEDGAWRAMEPDAPKLPFYKPAKKIAERIMVHEGAKAAAHVNWLVHSDDREAIEARVKHPWGEDLAQYEHWGLIGGALAPHRADYAELEHEKPTEVIYVCDNDWPGRTVLREFSKDYGGMLQGIKFDGKWPLHWDMADPIPETMYRKTILGPRYGGPALRELVIPATRATELLPNPEGKGRPIASLRRPFREEWMHSVRPEAFVHCAFPDRILTAAEFNSVVGPFSDVDDTSRLVRKDEANKTVTLHYLPSQPSGIFSSTSDGHFINTHTPSAIKEEKGSNEPWHEFMTHLFPDEADRESAYRWCATLIGRPDIKMLYGILLISEAQGVGKTTLGERILAPLVGKTNVSYPSEQDIVDSNFNYWLAHKRLAIVNEIYAGSSAKAYNRLKSTITDRYLMVNKKYQANYEVENWIHIFACSNSNRALQLSADDRRWFVPGVTEETQNKKYWTILHDWLENGGGLGIIKRWAKEWLLEHHPVMPGDRAPESAAKMRMIEDSMSPGMKLVADALDDIRARTEGARGIYTTDEHLVQFIRDRMYDGRASDRLEKPSTVRRVAKAKGWFIGEERVKANGWGGGIFRAKIIASDPQTASRDASGLLAEGKKPYDLNALNNAM